MSKTNINILLIGDYSIFRNALRMLIETKNGLKVISETADLTEASAVMSKAKPDLILIDMPESQEKNLFSFLEQIVEQVPILVLAGKHDFNIYQKCLRFGISGLVSKEKKSDILFKAIEKVTEGELWFDRMIMGQTIKQLVKERNSPQRSLEANLNSILSDREKQVVDLICKGLKNKGIAEKLFITETTVRHHLTSIFNKLEITSRLELVIYAFKNNLVKVPPSNGDGSSNGSHQFV